jgi:hypothetical protein
MTDLGLLKGRRLNRAAAFGGYAIATQHRRPGPRQSATFRSDVR